MERYNYGFISLVFFYIKCYKCTGEQLSLLARGSGGGDGVWDVEGETGPNQQ